MMTKGGCTKIVNSLTPGQGFLCEGEAICGIVIYLKNALSSTLSLYSTLIVIVLGVIMLLSYAIVEYYSC